MAILEIEKFNSKVLRKKAKKIAEINDEIKKLALDMIETMRTNNGIGLAAPQVGVSKRIVVIDENKEILTLINPKIISKKGAKIIQEEGCLSFPEIYLNIKRSDKVEVEALNLDGEKIRIQAEGLLARVIQHEIDHINGIPFLRRLNIIEKVRFKFKHWSLKL